MKSERDFANRDQFREYLTAYYAGQCLADLANNDSDPATIALTAAAIAESLVNRLYPKS